jgi:ribosome maturation factor RimP
LVFNIADRAGWRFQAAGSGPTAFLFAIRALPEGTAKLMRGKTAEDLKLLDLLDPVAEAAGYEIVRLRLMGGDQQRRLQIMAERPDGDMNVEDCAKLSRAVSEVLDAADPITGEYVLEVSSPGVDRPLTRLKDFATYEGYEARLELDRMAEGRKRFRGQLAGVDGDNVAIDLEGEEHTALIPFAWIIDAKLVLTDQLMKRGADERAARVAAEQQQDTE